MDSSKFASFRQNTDLTPAEISLEDLKRLYNALLEVNSQAAKLETEYRISTKELVASANDHEGASPDKTDDVKASDSEPKPSETTTTKEEQKPKSVVMPFRIEVEGSKGEYVASINSSILDQANLPGEIKKIKFDNTFWCNSVNKYLPVRQFSITIDFSTNRPLNLGRSASQKTENTSLVSVWGIDQVWVNGTSKIIVDTLQRKKATSRFLHTGFTYDVLLWLLLIPLWLWSLSRLDTQVKAVLFDKTGAFIGIAYLLCTLFFVSLFKMTFDYARWLFPYMTLKEYPRQLQTVQRTLLGAIILGIIGSLMAGIISGHG